MIFRCDNVYNLNLKRLSVLLIPPFLRKPLTLVFAEAMVRPLDRTLTDLKDFRQTQLLYAGITSSVCRLEYLLNTVFYPDGLELPRFQRIYIEDADLIDPKYIYVESEEKKPIYLEVSYWYTQTETGAVPEYNFIVYVPNTVPDFDRQIPRFEAVLDSFKLPDKKYAPPRRYDVETKNVGAGLAPALK